MGFSEEEWSFNGISPNIGIEWDDGEIPWRNWQTHQETAGAIWLKLWRKCDGPKGALP